MSDRFEEVKSIGDAGDSMPNCSDTQQSNDGPVCEMVRCIKLALHCGDHQSLKLALEKLETWKSEDDDRYHDYWRVAQLTGETELKSLYILLTVTSEKPENVRWIYLKDALSLLAMCLCNREIISSMLAYAGKIQPVLNMALNQDCDQEVYSEALSIINKALVVCRARFAKFLLTTPFLDVLVERIKQRPLVSFTPLDMFLQVIKSLLMCGQENTFNYATQVIKELSDTFERTENNGAASTDENQNVMLSDVLGFYGELAKSIETYTEPQECAHYWTKGRSRKDLLREVLEQPWLFIYCSWPPCGVHNGIPKMFFRKCAACSVVRYCSRQCQTKHWEAGHNLQCKAIMNCNKSV